MRWILLSLLLFLTPFSVRVTGAATLPDPVQFSVSIEIGNIDQAREWLDAGLSPNFEGRTIGTGLMIAAWEGNIPMMELFLARGGDVNHVNALGEQALLHAAWKGRLDAVRWLVEHGATLERPGKAWAALHYAAFAGHQAVVDYLIERGANVNALSVNGSTPLMMAAREGKEEIANRLLGAGANDNIVNEWGDNARSWALRSNNMRIAERIAQEKFPDLAQTSVATPIVRSVAIPDAADKLMAQARRMESFGRFAEAAKLYREAFAVVRKAGLTQVAKDSKTAKDAKPKKAEMPRVVSGLTITARRRDPTVQSVGLQYLTPASQLELTAQKVVSEGNPVPGSGGPAAVDVNSSAQANAERFMQQAREHEEAGRKREALLAYRAASAALRGR
jgi:ankyrin repeat protein